MVAIVLYSYTEKEGDDVLCKALLLCLYELGIASIYIDMALYIRVWYQMENKWSAPKLQFSVSGR